jgi:hypothetical protein
MVNIDHLFWFVKRQHVLGCVPFFANEGNTYGELAEEAGMFDQEYPQWH